MGGSSALTNTAVSLMQNLANDLPALWSLLVAIAAIAGVIMCGYSLLKAIEYQRRGESMIGAFVLFALGIGLVNLTFFVDSATQTIGFQTGNLQTFSYTGSSGAGSSPTGGIPSFAFVILKFFGWLATFRAFILWSESARSGSPPGTVWRGTTHFVAGIGLINIDQFLGMMGNYMS